MIAVGTSGGLFVADGDSLLAVDRVAGRSVTALAGTRDRWSVLLDGRTILEGDVRGHWHERAVIGPEAGTCLASIRDGLLIGTEQAHLLRLTDGTVERVVSFETVEGREAWYTPWDDPPDVRSIAIGAEGALYVNVHVGGVVRSHDGGGTWAPTLDIESDVHQVVAAPRRPGVALVAAAVGFGVSRDGGASWEFLTGGLHARYLRAVTVSGDAVLVSASTGPRGRRSALYRKPLDGSEPFVRCTDGLPTWFEDNIDTACLAAAGALVVFGTGDGRLFRSLDGGVRWELMAKGLPPITCVTVG
jgi:hypothetical protein